MLDELAISPPFAEAFSIRGRVFFGIFDNEFLELVSDLSETRAGSESRQPVITCRSSDVKSLQIVPDDVIERLSDLQGYRVKYESPDGTGLSQLFLRR